MKNTGGHLRPFRVFGTPPGTCPECAEVHDATQPHTQQSIAYQYKFYDRHGRWPTWSDAMEHCTDIIKEYWITALREAGIDILGEEGKE